MFPSIERFLFVILALIAVYSTLVECLSCVQCSSILDAACVDGRVEPTPCAQSNAEYCIKYEGEIQDTKAKLVIRECSDMHEASECKTKYIQAKPVNVCFSSCTTDGCNGNVASTLSTNVLVLLLVTCLSTLRIITGMYNCSE